jgi:hypothetical protein
LLPDLEAEVCVKTIQQSVGFAWQLEKLEAEQKAVEAEEAKTMATRKGKEKGKRSGANNR